jgi:hypothetical protein
MRRRVRVLAFEKGAAARRVRLDVALVALEAAQYRAPAARDLVARLDPRALRVARRLLGAAIALLEIGRQHDLVREGLGAAWLALGHRQCRAAFGLPRKGLLDADKRLCVFGTGHRGRRRLMDRADADRRSAGDDGACSQCHQ